MIWLTGASGYVGAHVLRRLAERDVPVRCLVLPNDSVSPAATGRVVDGTANLLRFAAQWRVKRFVYISAVSAVYETKNVYGRGGGLHFQKLVSLVERAPGILPILGAGRARLQPVWIDDLVTAIDLVLACPKAIGKTYNVSGATVVTFDGLVDRLVAAAGDEGFARVFAHP